MPEFPRALLHAWGRGILEVLLFYPVLLLLSPIPGMGTLFPYWVVALTLYMPLGTLSRLVLRTEIRFLLILVGVILVGGTSYLAFGQGLTALLTVAAGGTLYYHGFRSVRTAWHFLFPVGLYWICLFAYMLVAVIVTRISIYDPYSASLGPTGAIALVLTMFLSNTNNLKEETHSGKQEVRLAQGVVWKNRILIGIVLVAVLLIGLIGPIKRMVAALKNFLLEQINALIRLLNRNDGESPPPTPSASPPPMGMPQGDDKGPSAFVQFLETVFFYVGVVIIAAIALAIVYFIVRIAIRQIRRLIAWLKERGEQEASGIQDYEEEKTNLLDWSEMRKMMGDRFASFVARFEREPSWDRMSSSERIRHLYRAFVRRSAGNGLPYEAHLTAKEQLASRQDRQLNEQARGELSEAYNAARYGGEPVDPAVADRLKKESGL